MLTQDSLAPIRNDASSVGLCSLRPHALPDDPATLRQILRAALAEIERQRLIIAALQRNRFGRRSEQLDDATVQQGVEDLEQSVAEQTAAVEAAMPPRQTGRNGSGSASAAHRAGETQSWRTAGASAAGRVGGGCRGQGVSLLRRHTACHR